MPERNVERARRVLEAFNARDIDAMLAYSDPRVAKSDGPSFLIPGPGYGKGEGSCHS